MTHVWPGLLMTTVYPECVSRHTVRVLFFQSLGPIVPLTLPAPTRQGTEVCQS